MRPKQSPHFLGVRLQEARIAFGMTASALADLLGLSRQVVSNYENGKRTPDYETLEKIAHTLGFPIEFFCKEKRVSEEHTAIHFRSMSATVKMARERAHHRLEWMREIVQYLEEFIELPPPNLPHFDVPQHPEALSMGQIEELAVATRQFWGLGNGPISNVVWLLENNGCIVSHSELLSDKLDALSRWCMSEGRAYILLGSDKESACRSRFNACHELAHIILHPYLEPRHLRDKALFKLIEQQAHRFAGAFLFPETSFIKEVLSIQLAMFRQLKPRWNVAIGRMVQRALDLGLIDREQQKKLRISMARKKWHRREPLDDETPMEEPRLLKRAFLLLRDEGIQQCDDVTSSLPFRKQDLATLTNLSPNYFENISQEIIPFPRPKVGQSNPGDTSEETSADVVDLATASRSQGCSRHNSNRNRER